MVLHTSSVSRAVRSSSLATGGAARCSAAGERLMTGHRPTVFGRVESAGAKSDCVLDVLECSTTPWAPRSDLHHRSGRGVFERLRASSSEVGTALLKGYISNAACRKQCGIIGNHVLTRWWRAARRKPEGGGTQAQQGLRRDHTRYSREITVSGHTNDVQILRYNVTWFALHEVRGVWIGYKAQREAQRAASTGT